MIKNLILSAWHLRLSFFVAISVKYTSLVAENKQFFELTKLFTVMYNILNRFSKTVKYAWVGEFYV
ncbi:hypothetical protein ABG79_01668 [Caloramator mitchellensis]|uniref:Uncharacterized protein n=1 Tax=Caloramator mitchellensis TaxID=908809 RepID=A0A0R3K0S2_CALMK|nr:hypothetical protein ABG79_01668 [Caloramator mitchellensis]